MEGDDEKNPPLRGAALQRRKALPTAGEFQIHEVHEPFFHGRMEEANSGVLADGAEASLGGTPAGEKERKMFHTLPKTGQKCHRLAGPLRAFPGIRPHLQEIRRGGGDGPCFLQNALRRSPHEGHAHERALSSQNLAPCRQGSRGHHAHFPFLPLSDIRYHSVENGEAPPEGHFAVHACGNETPTTVHPCPGAGQEDATEPLPPETVS